MTDTGYKNPLTVAQDSRREVNGGNHTCYAFSNLDNIKNNDNTYAYIPSSGGIDSLRASPVIYAYNYNFQIPLDAKITKVEVLPVVQQSNGKNYGNVTQIKTVKLKTGASTTDYGVGNNLGDTTTLECNNIDLRKDKNNSETDVKELQRVLKELGYYTSTVDGSFGPVTRRAVISFQSDYGLATDGVVGPITCSHLHGLTNCKIPIATWSTSSTFAVAGENRFSGDGTKWGVDLTPAVVNNTNFGCVFQVKGTRYKKWVTPWISKLQMKVEYNTTGEDTSKINTSHQSYYMAIAGTELKFDSNNVCNTTFTQLDVNDPTKGVTFFVRYTHKGEPCDSKILTLSGPNLNISTNNYKKYSFPTIHFGSDSANKYYPQTENIYPSFVGGVQILTIEIDGKVFFVKFNVANDSFSDAPSVDADKIRKEGQFCQIDNCTFKNNTASYTHPKTNKKYGEGGGACIVTEHFKYNLKSSDFSNNVAGVNANNLSVNGVEKF